jgi:hypothetical protein
MIIHIGLTSTGTTSLAHALQCLAYRIGHINTRRDAGPAAVLDPAYAAGYDVLLDIPCWYYWRELFGVYPDALFILTDRRLDRWLASCRRHWSAGPKSNPYYRDMDRRYWGSDAPNDQQLINVWHGRRQQIEATIPARQLLVLDICAGDGWQPLCQFLGRDVPSVPFPWRNRHR